MDLRTNDVQRESVAMLMPFEAFLPAHMHVLEMHGCHFNRRGFGNMGINMPILLDGARGFDKMLDVASSNSGLYVLWTVHTNFQIILLIIPTCSTTQGYAYSGLYIHLRQTSTFSF